LPALAGAVLALAACGRNTPTGRVCTLVACLGQLQVVLDGPGASRVTGIRVSAADSSRLWSCTAATPCTGAEGVSFSGFTPDTVTIRVVTATDSTAFTVAPAYTTVYPNGPGCPGECRTASVAITISP
ncbi:MAG: hypothetical protein KGL38_13750, partial [Gemmatimonadota bacterium]|nr:hypothetical protein [Gemmatimonadota bacterium]